MKPSGHEIIKLLKQYHIHKEEDVEDLDVHFTLDSLKQLEISEDHHFWHLNRKYLIKKIIKKYTSGGFKAVDIGCGNGSIVSAMENIFPDSQWTGIDGHLQGLINARRRTTEANLEWQDITKLKNHSDINYDVALLLDVMEHLDHPEQTLQSLKPHLTKDGIVVATVPADQKLWSKRDEFLGHRKRYSTKDLKNLFEENGYRVIKKNYCFSHLYLPAWVFRKMISSDISGQQVEEEELKVRPVINPLMTFLGKIEMNLSLTLPLPFGTTAWCIAKKKE